MIISLSLKEHVSHSWDRKPVDCIHREIPIPFIFHICDKTYGRLKMAEAKAGSSDLFDVDKGGATGRTTPVRFGMTTARVDIFCAHNGIHRNFRRLRAIKQAAIKRRRRKVWQLQNHILLQG